MSNGQQPPPPQHEPSSPHHSSTDPDPNPTPAGGTETLQHESDPQPQQTPTEVASEPENPGTLTPSSTAAVADQDIQETRPLSEHTTLSPPADSDLTQAGDTAPAAVADPDPHVQESSSADHDETETDGTGAPATDAHSHPPNTSVSEITADEEPKLGRDAQEISPANDEATAAKADLTPEAGGSEPSKPDPADVADPHVQESSSPKKATPSETDVNPSGQQPRQRPSLWKKIRNMCRLPKGKRAVSKESPFRQSSERRDKPTDDGDQNVLPEADINIIKADLDDIMAAADELMNRSKLLQTAHTEATRLLNLCTSDTNNEGLNELKKAIPNLKLRISPMHKVDADELDYGNILPRIEEKKGLSKKVLNIKRALHKNVRSCVELNDFEARYNELSPELKLCLLCFSIFPKDAVIKKRLMVQWWVCEGFADEDRAHSNFIQLMQKGFIQPVNKNKSRSVGRCRMHPFYRAALATLAERAKFFNFNDLGKPTQKFSTCFQACLMGDGVISYNDLECELGMKGGNEKKEKPDSNKSEVKKDSDKEKDDLDEVLKNMLKRVHLVINVKETHVEFKPDWFSMMSDVNFIHLGSWATTDHIEVESTEFLEKAKDKEFLKFLSLQGLANVIDLPDSISHFTVLKILDVRACHNLESIPKGIGRLKNLTQLDMSECYLLEQMPRSLANLTQLEVLKGFVANDRKNSCTLGDLTKLQKLRKLCIFTNLRDFPDDHHVADLKNMRSLLRLAITWGGSDKATSSPTSKPSMSSSESNHLPSELQKLDLKCFPKSETPKWLSAEHLQKLEKLYIRGGKFSDLGQYEGDDDWSDGAWPGKKKHAWKVKELRLKYLYGIEMEWSQLQELFPDLEYLEQVGCPKLTFFPCDANGVWINK